jgi:hypothetical protein
VFIVAIVHVQLHCLNIVYGIERHLQNTLANASGTIAGNCGTFRKIPAHLQEMQASDIDEGTTRFNLNLEVADTVVLAADTRVDTDAINLGSATDVEDGPRGNTVRLSRMINPTVL